MANESLEAMKNSHEEKIKKMDQDKAMEEEIKVLNKNISDLVKEKGQQVEKFEKEK